MIYVLFICSLLLYIILKGIKTYLSQSTTDLPSTKLSVVKGLLHFIIVFVFIAIFFCIVQFWVDNSTNIDETKASIEKFELTELRIKNIIKYFKISWYADILFIVALITMAGSFPIIEKYKFQGKFKKLNKLVSTTFYILTISTSFTYFGQKLSEKEDERISKLEFHRLQIIENNQLLLQSVKEKVTQQAVNEILNNPKVQSILSKIEKEDSIIRENMIPFGNKYKSTFKEDLEPREWREQDEEQELSNNKELYSEFKKNNNEWFSEQNLSEYNIEQTKNVFLEGDVANSTNYSKYYEKYKEPFEKLVKNIYSKTGKVWIKKLFGLFGIDFPFADEFIDPIVNDPLEELINKKTEAIFKGAWKGNAELIKKEFNLCNREIRSSFNAAIQRDSKFGSIDLKISEYVPKSVSVKTEINFPPNQNIEIGDVPIIHLPEGKKQNKDVDDPNREASKKELFGKIDDKEEFRTHDLKMKKAFFERGINNLGGLALSVLLDEISDKAFKEYAENRYERISDSFEVRVPGYISNRLKREAEYFDSLESLILKPSLKLKIIKKHFPDDSDVIRIYHIYLKIKDDSSYFKSLKKK